MKSSDGLTERDQWHLLESWERVRAGTASGAEVAELNERLQREPAVRRWLAGAVVLEAELRYEGGTPTRVEDPPGTLAVNPQRKGWLGLRISHAAAAGLAAMITWSFWASIAPTPPVATLVRAQSCKWGNSALPTLEGSELTPGSLVLLEGMATLHFKSGAELVLEAPVSLEVVSAMEARLQHGTVVAEVPPQAKGFTIRTPETTVVDLGTRFGVSAGEDGKCLVHVIEGLVQVDREGEEKVRVLRGGERVDYGGLTHAKVHPDADKQLAEPGRWLPAPPMTEWGGGWQAITTAFGRGRDSWIQSNTSHVITGRETFLRVKHTTLDKSLERKTYLAFDLAKVDGRIAEAELELYLEPSDLGYGSLVPDASFGVYGLTVESEDEWSESGLHWTNAPAHSLEPEHHAKPDMQSTVHLGSFTVEQGRQSGAVRIQGEALAGFLRQDTNGLVTFIVCRETDETARNGLVHAFASKENPRNSPPMLRIRVE